MTVLLASLAAARAQTTLTAWTFDNLSIGANSSPQPSTGFGSAAALGMGNSYNNTNSISNPDVQSLPGSSTVGANSWRIRGFGTAPNGGNGWSSSAPVGTQGAQFSASTAGLYRVMLSFDVYATPDAEANLQVQYTTDGNIWRNATITSVGTLGTIANNSATNQTVMGSYVILTNNGTTGWNNQITVDLSGVSGVDNDAAFAVRIVNASAGTNCVDTTGAPYNNTSGNWTLDNVVVQGVPIDTITEWTFDSNGTDSYVPNPVPEFSVGNTSFAQALGFNTSFLFSDGSDGSTNDPDTLVQAGSSTGNNGPICWRVRGQGPGNGWYTTSGIGTQGAEFDVSTVNYTNIVISFDLYFTSQAESKMMVQYTLDGSTWFNATNLAYGANPTFIVTNSPAFITDPPYSPDTVLGTYFSQTTGQNWYNNLIVDFTGISGANNNPSFGIRVVNAAQNGDCLNYTGGTYNNSSGNCRFDNVTFGGHFVGSIPPVITYAANATVDGPFTNTFTDDPTWRSSITTIYANGSILPSSAYITTQAGEIIFVPANSPALQASGSINLVYLATGYNSDKVTQPLLAGVAKQLALTMQPAGPTASGGTLIANPALAITDQYGNGSTNPYPSVTVTASVGSGNWSMGGATVQAAVNGFITFTNLTATNNTAASISTANIKFAVNGYGSGTTNITSANFTVGVAPILFTPGDLAVLQIDTVSNNTTFSMIEVKSSTGGQKTPVNTVPISATGTNALRESSAGSTGRLALSDDGTLLCFAAFADGSSATLDETLVLPRAVGTLNYSNVFAEPLTYTSSSLGGSQARAATSVDNINYVADDKGNLFEGGALQLKNVDIYNNVSVKSFGKTVYVETQKTANGSPIPVVYELGLDEDGYYEDAIVNNLGTDPIATDFYLTSTNGGTTFDVMYVMDQASATQGIIKKYSRVYDGSPYEAGSWIANGTFTNGTGGDGLFACTNGSGNTYLYYTTGGGGTAGNSIVRLTDASAWDQPIDIISSNLIYTASKTTSIKGLTFVPQQVAYTNEVMPTPVLTIQTFATTNATFAITNSPDDPAWRAAMTSITVNGSVLSPAAYNLTQSGQIVFDPSQSALLQSPGSKTIVFSATGYITNSVTQVVAGVPAKLALGTALKAPVADGGPFATEPTVIVTDAGGNAVFSTVSISAAASSASWILGGNTSIAAVNGTTAFTNLTAFCPTNGITGAKINYTASGLTGISSAAFNIPAPVHSILKSTTVNGTNLTFTFTNFTGLSFSVVATNDITAPLATWPVVGAAVESPAGSGHYSYTNSAATNSTQFYILRQP